MQGLLGPLCKGCQLLDGVSATAARAQQHATQHPAGTVFATMVAGTGARTFKSRCRIWGRCVCSCSMPCSHPQDLGSLKRNKVPVSIKAMALTEHLGTLCNSPCRCCGAGQCRARAGRGTSVASCRIGQDPCAALAARSECMCCAGPKQLRRGCCVPGKSHKSYPRVPHTTLGLGINHRLLLPDEGQQQQQQQQRKPSSTLAASRAMDRERIQSRGGLLGSLRAARAMTSYREPREHHSVTRHGGSRQMPMNRMMLGCRREAMITACEYTFQVPASRVDNARPCDPLSHIRRASCQKTSQSGVHGQLKPISPMWLDGAGSQVLDKSRLIISSAGSDRMITAMPCGTRAPAPPAIQPVQHAKATLGPRRTLLPLACTSLTPEILALVLSTPTASQGVLTSRSRDCSMLLWLSSRLSARRMSVLLAPGVLPAPSLLLFKDPLLRELMMLASWLALGTCLASTGARDLMATLVSRQCPRCTRPMDPSPISRMKCCTQRQGAQMPAEARGG